MSFILRVLLDFVPEIFFGLIECINSNYSNWFDYYNLSNYETKNQRNQLKFKKALIIIIYARLIEIKIIINIFCHFLYRSWFDGFLASEI